MKKATIAAAGLLAAALALNIYLQSTLSEKKDRLLSLGTSLEEMHKLRGESSSLNLKINEAEGRKNLTGIKGVVHAVDEIFVPLGLKGKVKSLKQLPAEVTGQERAEVIVQGATMNEMVNFLYAIENSHMLLIPKKIHIKPAFENPSLLNITMTLSFVKPE